MGHEVREEKKNQDANSKEATDLACTPTFKLHLVWPTLSHEMLLSQHPAPQPLLYLVDLYHFTERKTNRCGNDSTTTLPLLQQTIQ